MKTTLTHQEMLIAVRAHYKLPEDTEIVIEGQPEASSGWISNIGRNEYDPPKSLENVKLIKVKFRNGDVLAGHPFSWTSSWKETDGHRQDIVAYRIIK